MYARSDLRLQRIQFVDCELINTAQVKRKPYLWGENGIYEPLILCFTGVSEHLHHDEN